MVDDYRNKDELFARLGISNNKRFNSKNSLVDRIEHLITSRRFKRSKRKFSNKSSAFSRDIGSDYFYVSRKTGINKKRSSLKKVTLSLILSSSLLFGGFETFNIAKNYVYPKINYKISEAKYDHKFNDISSSSQIDLKILGKNYSFKKSDDIKNNIDMVLVDWEEPVEASKKYDRGIAYFLNFGSKKVYDVVKVVGGEYENNKPTSPHNSLFVAGTGVLNPSWAEKGMVGGDPNNPFGKGLVTLYQLDAYLGNNFDDVYFFIKNAKKDKIDSLLNDVDKRQLHGKRISRDNESYLIPTWGCIRMPNTEITELVTNKKSRTLVYFPE